MVVNEVLSEKMHVKPLKEDEVVQFKLCSVGKMEKGREEPAKSIVYMLAEKCNVYDPFAKRPVTIGNVTSLEEVRESGGRPRVENGNKVMGYKLEKVEFFKGFKTVNFEQQNTYAYMMRHKGCKDNPFRPRTVRAVFELMSMKKDVEDAIQSDDLQFKAIKLIRESNWDDIRATRAKLNSMADQRFRIGTEDLQGMKIQMVTLAKNYPKQVILASNDLQCKQAVHIYDALAFGILVYDEGQWYKKSQKGMNSILTVPADKDKVEALVDHFQTKEGNGMHVQIKADLKEILTTIN